MLSPFPGMDPYLEQSKLWVDFHNSLADEMRAQLNTQIRPGYFARLTPYTTYEAIEIGQSTARAIRPDVGVMQPGPTEFMPQTNVAVLEIDTPVESEIDLSVPVDLLSVEIYNSDETLITAIEILSPVNKKPGHKGFTDYERKREELFHSSAHLIEIDFLREGTRPRLARPVPITPYYIMLSRMERRPKVDVWPIPIAAKLPKIPIPLRTPDPDAILDMSQVMENVYERGAYDVQIDYEQPVPPPEISSDEQAWVTARLQQYRQGLV